MLPSTSTARVAALTLCAMYLAAAENMFYPEHPRAPSPAIPPANATSPILIGGGMWLNPWQTALACVVVLIGFIITGGIVCLVMNCLKPGSSRSSSVQPAVGAQGHSIMMVEPASPHLGTSSTTLAKFATLTFKGESASSTREEKDNDPENGGDVPPGFIVSENDQNVVTSASHLAGSTALECIFCQHGYEVGDKVMQLPCGHIFHKDDGIIPWMKKQGYCPICHASYPG